MASVAVLYFALAGVAQASSSSSGQLRIALYGGPGAFLHDHDYPYYATLEKAAAALGDFSIVILNGSTDVQNHLTNDAFDVVFVPGGGGTKEALGLGERGMAAMRAFVSAGGGYIGTCAGAFLALEHLRLYGDGPEGKGIPAQSLGEGKVGIGFTEGGLEDFHLNPRELEGNISIWYEGGPIVAVDVLPSHVNVLAWYRTDVPATPPAGKNTPSMTYAEYGAGRVVLNSPHAEHVKSAAGIGEQIYRGELAWAAKYASQLQVMLV